MKTYELSYIVSPEVTSEEATAKAKEIETAILSREGVILKQSNPIARTLAYPIAKKASGFLGVIEFTLEGDKLVELKEMVQKDGKIVRHMVIIKEPIRIRKERRSKRILPETIVAEQKTETEVISETVKKEEKTAAPKVELKDIEQQLDEILG